MVQIKKAPISKFEEHIKKSIADLELIKSKQEQKQAVLDEYEKQHKRYADGRISRRAYQIAVNKNRALLSSLDSQIKGSINTSKRALQNALRITAQQAPARFNVSLEGLKSPARRVVGRIKSVVKPRRRPAPKRSVVKRKRAPKLKKR